jgi:hypothetical protein
MFAASKTGCFMFYRLRSSARFTCFWFFFPVLLLNLSVLISSTLYCIISPSFQVIFSLNKIYSIKIGRQFFPFFDNIGYQGLFYICQKSVRTLNSKV